MTTDAISLAHIALPMLFVMLGVATAAYLTRSRLVFVLGLLGCLFSLLIRQPRIYSEYRDPVGAHMAMYSDAMSHSLKWSLICAAAGVMLGLIFRRCFQCDESNIAVDEST